MNKLFVFLLAFGMAHAEFDYFDGQNLKQLNASSGEIIAAINRLTAAVEKQTAVIEKLLPKEPQKTPAQKTEEYMAPIKENNPKLYEHKLVFPEDQKQMVDEQTQCIQECAETYDTTDKFELKDCLMELCGFTFEEIFK